jgi:hypothetical protein
VRRVVVRGDLRARTDRPDLLKVRHSR